MEVLDAHCGFLSNFEVLQLLREDVAEQDIHVKALKQEFEQLKKKKRGADAAKAEPYLDFQEQLSKIVPHNVRTLQVESLQYLRQKDLPCRLQSAEQIAQIAQAIEQIPCKPVTPGERGSNALTKTEKLVMINLAPVGLVDLTVIVDELENRFSEEAQQQLINVFLDHYGAEIGMAPVELGHSIEGHHQEEFGDQGDEDEGMDYDETQDLPDEEYDLVDEGMGDGGRDAEVRELDEVAD